MGSEAQMIDVVHRFSEALNHRQSILECFCQYGVQIEGWLKGEFLHFLHIEKASSRLYGFDREAAFGQGRRKVDVKLTDEDSQITWVELKHWLIGRQRGHSYDASFYFNDSSSVGIKPDVEKLKLASGNRYVLVLATANPGADGWSKGVERFNHKFSPLRVTSLTDPRVYPTSYFLGLLSTD